MIQYYTIFHKELQLLRHYIHQNFFSWQTPHGSPVMVSHGVSVVRIFEKIYHVIMTLHCITYRVTMTSTGYRSDHKLTTDTPYLTFVGEFAVYVCVCFVKHYYIMKRFNCFVSRCECILPWGYMLNLVCVIIFIICVWMPLIKWSMKF